MTEFIFNLKKTVQSLAFLMCQPGKDCRSILKLIKLLYLAERESLAETGHPITGDRLVAMKHGPVLSKTYDYIKGEEQSEEWDRYFADADNHQLRLRESPGDDLLCEYEMRKLKMIASRFSHLDRWEVRDKTHELPEWKKNDPGQTSRLIPLVDLMEAVNATSEDIAATGETSRLCDAMGRALGA
jgi:uncharacterized phage-associated protein